MTLTGKRPSLDELEAVRSDPSALPEIVAGYLETDAFGTVVRDMHDEWWLLESSIGALPVVGLDPAADPATMIRDLPNQPLSLVERVVREEMPYSEIILADWTMGNRVASSAWVGMVEPSEEFVPTEWNDGRPAAGMLSESWVYVAYRSAPGNHNRRRANAFSRTLLCLDFLAAIPIPDEELNLDDPEEVTDAVRNDPACASCHDNLDPLASFLAMRPYPVLTEETWPLAMYHPSYEDMWQEVDGLPPAYFGAEGEGGVVDLARFIADDPRFYQCTVRRFVSYLEQTPLEQVDYDRVLELTDTFEANELDAKQLVFDLVTSERFASLDDDGPGPQMIRPEQVGPLFDDLVGFTWSTESDALCCGNKFGSQAYGHVPDLARDAYVGHRLLLGGVDAPNVTLPSHTATPSAMVALRNYARLAANHEVSQWADGEPRLLTVVSPGAATDADAVRQQVIDLHARLYAEFLDPDDPDDAAEIDATVALFDELVARLGDPAEAWEMTLWAMFQDLKMVMY